MAVRMSILWIEIYSVPEACTKTLDIMDVGGYRSRILDTKTTIRVRVFMEYFPGRNEAPTISIKYNNLP